MSTRSDGKIKPRNELLARHAGGCTEYTVGEILVRVCFPKGFEKCRFCEFLRSDASGARYVCMLSRSIIFSIDCIDENCPVTWIADDKKEEDEDGNDWISNPEG